MKSKNFKSNKLYILPVSSHYFCTFFSSDCAQNEPGAFTEEEIKKFRSVPVPIKKFSADYAWREDDPTVPPGRI